MDRIDVRIPLGSTEVWEITNQQMGMGMMSNQPHSMHLHDVQFQVLDINGQRPPENLRGWKDTVLVWPGETVRVIARFADFTGIYMYHCHFLEHEDAGMMGQFEVYKP
jgi:FtsP/CotA-like multicopper oxidase with cupredoxin domain